MDLSESSALVTGASSGIGAATARALGAAGCDVALLARREDRLMDVAASIDGAETLVVPADVTDSEAVAEAVAETTETFGALDVLVNNAGLARGDPVAEADLADLHAQVDVNLGGVMRTTHAALPHLLDGDGGHVVTVSSMNARHPAAGASAYTASKYGVNGFCDSLRKELSDEQVRVTVVMPGPVVTEMRDWADWDGRPLQPGDVADTIAYTLERPAHVELPEIIVNSTDKLG